MLIGDSWDERMKEWKRTRSVSPRPVAPAGVA